MSLYVQEKVLYAIGRLRNLLQGKSTQDDYHWDLYSTLYRGELKSNAEFFTSILKEGDYVYNQGSLIKSNSNSLPLHANHRLIYETILQLNPSSVFELGCGGGDLLHNINLLNRNIKLYGADLSVEQLQLFKERHPKLNASVHQYNCTLPFPTTTPQVDIAYTQAVIMHIQTGNSHLIALSNLFRVATKQVILMENWTKHEFLDDIKKLHALKIIPWSEIYFYYRESEEFKKPHLMVVSSQPLQYSQLTDFSILRDGVGR